MRRKILVFVFMFITTISFAETITLKNGKIIEGKIVERTYEQIKLDIGADVLISYYFDEIRSVDGVDIVSPDSIGDTAPSDKDTIKLNVAFGNPQMAIGFYEDALEENPNDAVALNQIGMSYNQLQQYSEAIPYLQKASELSPQQAETYHNLGYSYMLLEKFDKAEQLFLKALEIKPDYVEALSNLGYIKLANRNYQEAINYYQQAIKRNFNDASTYENIAFAYFTLGQKKDIDGYLKRARELYLENEDYQSVQRVDEVLKQIEGGANTGYVTNREPGPSFDGRNWFVGSFEKDIQQSLTEYVLEGETLQNWTELVTIEEVLGVQNEMPVRNFLQMLFQKVSQTCPMVKTKLISKDLNDLIYEFEFHDCLGTNEFEVGRIFYTNDRGVIVRYSSKTLITPQKREEWIKILKEIFFKGIVKYADFSESNPYSVQTGGASNISSYLEGSAQDFVEQAGYHAINEGNFQEAEIDFINAIKTDPYYEMGYYGLGTMYYAQMKQLDKAIDVFKDGLQYIPNSSRIHYALASVYFLKGFHYEAEESLKKAIESDDKFLEPYIALGSLYYENNKKREALDVFKKILEIEPNNELALNAVKNLKSSRTSLSKGFVVIIGIISIGILFGLLYTVYKILSQITESGFIKGFIILAFSVIAFAALWGIYSAWEDGGTQGLTEYFEDAGDAFLKTADEN